MYSRANPRRRHDAEFKAAVVAACDEPGASVAAVAQAHGLNANLVHQWRRGRGRGRGASAITAAAPVAAPVMETVSVATAAPVFIPVELPAPIPAPEVVQEIHIELRRGAVTVNVRWPMQAAAQCAAWLREVLR